MNAAGESIALRLMGSAGLWPGYTVDLCLEALLEMHSSTGEARYLDHVLAVWAFRGCPRNSLTIENSYFTCLHLETFLRTGDPRFVEGLPGIAHEWRQTAPRTPEGAAAHRKEPFGAVLLDMLAGYAPLMAAAGSLSGDESFFDECVLQCRLYRDILRNPATGLWHHARGWQSPGTLSPTGWCRGQGWAVRSLVKSLKWIPVRHPAHTFLLELLDELTADLLRYQQPSGMWHQLVNDPDSPPETSGTGLILHSLQMAEWNRKTAISIHHGVEALMRFVTPDGVVLNGCPGTPPLASLEEYRTRSLKPDDPHATAAVLMALARTQTARHPHPDAVKV